MWNSNIEKINEGRILKYQVYENQNLLTYAEVLKRWQQNADFRTYFNALLKDAPFAGFFWETPPITKSTINRNFEFVLVNSSVITQVAPAPYAFRDYFTKDPVVQFENLGKDALLVVPCPEVDDEVYTHIGNFVREAPATQQQALWEKVGYAIENRLSNQPMWVSTAGMGVYWLHIRLDSRPKYYRYKPFK